MKNAAPDVVIIGGAMDSHFTWRDAQSQSVEYLGNDQSFNGGKNRRSKTSDLLFLHQGF